MARQTLARLILEILAQRGVRYLFGVPGGGSSLDLIEAAGRAGIEFVLTRTETAAALMAAVSGELGPAPGVVLTGIGPGAASVVNGVAYASLERAPLLVFTDGPASSLHQAFDQSALFAPISKASLQLRPETAVTTLAEAIHCALSLPQGPVHLNLSAEAAGAWIAEQPVEAPAIPAADTELHSLTRATELFSSSRYPIIIAGLDSRREDAPRALGELAQALACPVLLSYKAKGVLADDSPYMAGLFTGARLEIECLEHADLIVFFGLDPVEVIPGHWPDLAPVLNICTYTGHDYPLTPEGQLGGPLANSVNRLLSAAVPASAWQPEDIHSLRETLRAPLILGGSGHTAASVVTALIASAPAGSRLCVDAGAHMFSAMGLWPAQQAYDVLKSNGLSTMGFALPAAIASALLEPERPVIALTGDGGLLMCLAELTTALARRCRITVLVINDGALSLIDVKQQRRQQPCNGVRYPAVDFAAAARALGCAAWRVEPGDDLSSALALALACEGPSLVDVHVDASGYVNQLAALRG